MLELTYQNHFKYGFNQIPFSIRQSLTDNWFVSYGHITRPTLNFKEECIQTAKLIRDTKQGPLWILLSGGIDSEIVLRSFIEAHIPVRAAIIRFKSDLNIHDMSYAVIAAETLGVPYKIIDVDIIYFLNNTVYDIAKISYSSNLSMNVVSWCVSQIDGIPIIGTGDIYLELMPTGNYAMTKAEHIVGVDYYLTNTNRDGVPGFFQYTPEIMHSWLHDDLTKQFVNDSRFWGSTKLKFDIYRYYFNDAVDRTKYTGYEKLRWSYIQTNNKLKTMYGSAVAYIDHDKLCTMLGNKDE